MKAAILLQAPVRNGDVFSDIVRARIAEQFELLGVFTKEELLAAPAARELEVLFSTWGMPAFTVEEIRAALPSLRGVFYAAGSVQGFAREFLACGVAVSSAWVANAIPVAEFTVSQMQLAAKGMFTTLMRRPEDQIPNRERSLRLPGFYRIKIGIIGAGAIGGEVIRMLKRYEDDQLELLVFSQSMTEARAAELGVRKASLAEIFAECDIISNHLANNEQTVGMLNAALFDTMKPGVVFINTGRGAQVVESALADAMRARPDAVALLDVTWPEPPEAGHPFYDLPNVLLTPHIAGSQHNEVERMALWMLDDACALRDGEPLRYGVTLERLARMA